MDEAQANVNINEIVEQSLKEISSIDAIQTKEDNVKAQEPKATKDEPVEKATVSDEFKQPGATPDHEDKAIFEKVASEAEPLKEYEEIVI